jgi:hypothetical protein
MRSLKIISILFIFLLLSEVAKCQRQYSEVKTICGNAQVPKGWVTIQVVNQECKEIGNLSNFNTEDVIEVCNSDPEPEPEGWVVIEHRGVCASFGVAPNTRVIYGKVLKKIEGMAPGTNLEVTHRDNYVLPCGWIVSQVYGIAYEITNVVPAIRFWNKRITKTEGLPTGQLLSICSGEPVPAGWDLSSRGGNCLRITTTVPTTSYDTRIIKKRLEFACNAGANKPPIANGWLMLYYSPTSVLLNGWGSNDPKGGRITFSWKKTAGPDQYRILYANASTPVISDLVTGTYTFQLTVADELLNTATSDVTFSISAKNRPPIANGWLMKYYSPTSVLLNAWGSEDPEGGRISFWWEKIEGPASYSMLYGNSSTPVISDLVNGTYRFKLTVTDQEGATGRDTVEIRINQLANNNGNGQGLHETQSTLPGLDKGRIHLYPNPVTDILKLRWTGDYKVTGRATIMDVSGRAVRTMDLRKELAEDVRSFNVSELSPGIYLLRITLSNGGVLHERFLKN